jgi:hypothetical protein
MNKMQQMYVNVRFEVFTAVTMKNGVFWVVTPCGSYNSHTAEQPRRHQSSDVCEIGAFLPNIYVLIASVVYKSGFLATHPEVPGSGPGLVNRD